MNEKEFTRNYLGFLKVIRWFAYLRPQSLSYTLAAWYAKRYSPHKTEEQKIKQKLQQFLGSEHDWQHISNQHLAQHGAAMLNLFNYHRMSKNWIDHHLIIKQRDELEALQKNSHGSLLLTYHCQHQHTLGIFLGLAGLQVNPIAAAPETSPLYNDLKFYIDKLHHDTQQHFNGGKYLFLGPDAHFVRPIHRALSQHQLVLSLNDNSADVENSSVVNFFGKKMSVYNGSVKIARKMGVPIWAAITYWDKGDKFELQIKALDVNVALDEVMQQYIDFLQNILTRRPELWEGWRW